jgi:membrane protein YqaA with SNARE-associated domain
MNTFLKRLSNWVLHWAETPNGTVALFIFAFIEAIFFPVPADILLIALALACPAKAFRYALVCTLGSVSGALAGYTLGSLMWLQPNGEFSGFANFFFQIPGFTTDIYYNIRELYSKYDFWVIFTAGFIPVPYKIFTVTAGVFDLNLAEFMIASLISRGVRFFIISWLLWKYGLVIKTFVEKYLNWMALGFTVSLIGVFVLIKYVF